MVIFHSYVSLPEGISQCIKNSPMAVYFSRNPQKAGRSPYTRHIQTCPSFSAVLSLGFVGGIPMAYADSYIALHYCYMHNNYTTWTSMQTYDVSLWIDFFYFITWIDLELNRKEQDWIELDWTVDVTLASPSWLAASTWRFWPGKSNMILGYHPIGTPKLVGGVIFFP